MTSRTGIYRVALFFISALMGGGANASEVIAPAGTGFHMKGPVELFGPKPGEWPVELQFTKPEPHSNGSSLGRLEGAAAWAVEQGCVAQGVSRYVDEDQREHINVHEIRCDETAFEVRGTVLNDEGLVGVPINPQERGSGNYVLVLQDAWTAK